MDSSRFSHFNNAIYSGSTNNDDSDNEHLNNGAMIVTAGMCFRPKHYEGGNTGIDGSFVSVTVYPQGHYSDVKTTAVRNVDDTSSRVRNVPLKSLFAQEMDNTNIGYATIGMTNENQNRMSRMQKETNNYYEHSKLPITLPIGNPYIEYCDDFKGPDSICSQCVIS